MWEGKKRVGFAANDQVEEAEDMMEVTGKAVCGLGFVPSTATGDKYQKAVTVMT
jgi:hypothetical protein